jgi:hypothetical protein
MRLNRRGFLAGLLAPVALRVLPRPAPVPKFSLEELEERYLEPPNLPGRPSATFRPPAQPGRLVTLR